MRLERYKVWKPPKNGGTEIVCWKTDDGRYVMAERSDNRGDPAVRLAIVKGFDPGKRWSRGVSYRAFWEWGSFPGITHLGRHDLPDGDWGWYAFVENPLPYVMEALL